MIGRSAAAAGRTSAACVLFAPPAVTLSRVTAAVALAVSTGDDGAALASKQPGPGERLMREERLSLVRQAVRELRPEEQEVFLLRQNGQLSYEEIAETVDIPLGTVKTRMRLAISKLRKTLEGRD